MMDNAQFDWLHSFRFKIINTTLILCGEIFTRLILVIHFDQNYVQKYVFSGFSSSNHSINTTYLM